MKIVEHHEHRAVVRLSGQPLADQPARLVPVERVREPFGVESVRQ